MFEIESKSQMLRVPVRRAEVEIRTDRERANAVIFLPPEFSLEDLFEDDAPFFPADIGGKIRFIARASVVSVSVEADDAPPESVEVLGVPFETRAIDVRLANGESLAGTLTCAMGITRTLDFLNQRSRSFKLHEGGRVHHIAKAHVEHITETR